MNKNYEDINPDAIAVIGMACRFPGAKNINEFWDNLKNGVESISFFSGEEVVESGIDTASAQDPFLVKAFGVLEDTDKFDAGFFGFSPREAELLDPQNRLFLECAWEAFEDAAYNTDKVEDRVGVYASSSISTYLLKNLLTNKDLLKSVGGISALLGNDKDHVPTRVSYAMNLKGPSIAVGTACSSSLAAVHLACQGLLDFHCDMALAGGVTVHSNQAEGYFYNPEGIASPDGHCRTFDSKSGGTISGSGVGAVILKRFEDAVRDNDNIYAVVLSSAVNNDGAIKVGYTAPGIEGQSEVIAEAHNLADVSPDEVTYVETHGTATKLGDPIEISALKKAFGSSKGNKSHCALGSVKSNLGHLDSAAGIAGFIKTVLALKYKQIPPSLHFENHNPTIKIEDTPFYVNNKLIKWTADGIPRIAGVSSFAMGGTNAHVVLQEAGETIVDTSDDEMNIIPVSAKTEIALEGYLKNISAALKAEKNRLTDIAFTMQTGRKAFQYRKAFVVNDASGLSKELTEGKTSTVTADQSNTEIVFMFSGLGSHYEEMGIDLFNKNKIFRDSMIRCSNIFKDITGEDLLDVIYPNGIEEKNNTQKNTGIDFLKMVRGESNQENEESKLDKTMYAHPAIFSIEYSLAQMCLGLGIKPSALIGHSIGEYTAMCISGSLSLEDTLKLIIKRAGILETAPKGEMLTVDASEKDIEKYLTDNLSIAAVNDSSSCVIAGLKEDIDLLKNRLDAYGIVHRPVRTQKAFHSHLLASKEAELKKIFEGIQISKPQIPVISNLSGDWISEEEIVNPTYWITHTLKTVRFYNGIQKLFEEKYVRFLEIGPGQNLAGFVLKSNSKNDGKKIHVQTTMKNNYDSQSDYEYFMRTVAKLWTTGIDINWESLYKKNKPKRISLPTYPFEHKRYWIDEKKTEEDIQPVNNSSGIEYFTWEKSFEKIKRINKIQEDSHWIIFKNSEQNLDDLKSVMKKTGIEFITVLLSGEEKIISENEYAIDIGKRNSYKELFAHFEKNNITFKNIIYIPYFDKSNLSFNQVSREIISIVELLKVIQTSVKKVNFTFLLENAFAITGAEDIDSSSAAISGFINAISKEYENIKVSCYENDGSSNNVDYYESILSSIININDGLVTAYRNNSKWVPAGVKYSFNSANDHATKNDKILVLGSNEKLKEVVLEELKNTENVIAGFENRTITDAGQNDFISRIEKKIDEMFEIKSIDDYESLHEKLDQLCGAMSAGFILRLIGKEANKEIPIEKLYDKVAEKHRKFFKYLLNVSVEDGYIRLENDIVKILKGKDEIDTVIVNADIIKKDYPEIGGLLKLLEYAVSKYDDVFSGKLENVNVFYDNDAEIYNNLFSENPLRFEKHKVYIKTVKKLLNIILEHSTGKKINILEVGGGTGKLTGSLLPDLSDKNIEYHFTDIGKSFVAEAKMLAEKLNIDFMKFDTFDISKDPQKQGIESSKYDIVIAYDVIHATENIEETMKNLDKVAAPGGITIIVESVQPRRWTNMIWGLQTGWWYFKDDRNEKLSPLYSLDEWDEIMNKSDLHFSATYPSEQPRRNNTAFGLIVMQKKFNSKQNLFDLKNYHSSSKINTNKSTIFFKYDFSEEAKIAGELTRLKKEYGQFDSVFLCENNSGNIPTEMMDYEYINDEPGKNIERINKIINAIETSGLLRGKMNILFEKESSRFHSSESIVAEYLKALAGEKNIEINSVFVDPDYSVKHDEIKITEVTEKLSSAQIYFSPKNYNFKKNKKNNNIAEKHNVYSRPELSNAYVKPANEIEKILVDIWKVMFGIDQIGINDNFFELGGDSLMATKIITRIKQETDVTVKLPLFFQNPTIEELATRIISNKNAIDILTMETGNNNVEMEEGEI